MAAIPAVRIAPKNSYGHPTKPVLDALKKAKAVTYRTDLNGTVSVTSDGKNLSFVKVK